MPYPRTGRQLKAGRITAPANSVLGVTVGAVSRVDYKAKGRALPRFLWQFGVGCSRFLVNEPHGVADHVVDIPQVHALAGFIEPESKANRYPGARWRYLFIGTLNVLEVVSDNVHQFEFERLLAPLLAEICAAGSAFVGRANRRRGRSPRMQGRRAGLSRGRDKNRRTSDRR